MPSDADGWVKLPRSPSTQTKPFFPDVDGEVGIGYASGPRRSLSYYRLPEPLFRLSVLKLDGSSFDVQIVRNACVWQLKMAIEDIFNQSSMEGGSDISWSHVWGHFCLCYNDHKLTDDEASLRTFGIQDGDQLHFIRHLSVNSNPSKRSSRNHQEYTKRYNMSLTGSEVLEEVEENNKDKNADNISSTQFVDEGSSDLDEDDDNDGNTEFKLGHFFKGWFSYSRLRT